MTQTQTRISFSAMPSDRLFSEIKKRAIAHGPYSVEFHAGSEDFKSFCRAVKQGIDSHLEAVFFVQSSGVRFDVSAASLHVLCRRLMETGEDNDGQLASSICETLDIELI